MVFWEDRMFVDENIDERKRDYFSSILFKNQ
ncbi:hypothetical protein CM15mP35_05800 [bacterium]|nr:MAG: hypothetical protein CM15mP35_05800 [bacterium]